VSVRAPDRLVTERLIAERLRIEHGPELATLLRAPQVARTLFATGQPPTDAVAAERLAANVEHWTRHGFGMWLLRDRVTGTMVGRGGLQHTFVTGRDEVEVGWAIVPERWRQGLATELALASVDVAFGPLALDEIIAYSLPHNVASRRVMEKAGFTYDQVIVHVGLPHVLYRRRADHE
jgi:RimJ/RimL family protein N-acetyltransferase